MSRVFDEDSARPLEKFEAQRMPDTQHQRIEDKRVKPLGERKLILNPDVAAPLPSEDMVRPLSDEAAEEIMSGIEIFVEAPRP